MARDPYTQREDERALEDAEARKIVERERLDRLREHMPPAVTADDSRQAALHALLTELAKALRSHRLTVQVMPDGIEIIEVESGDLLRKLMLTEVAQP